MRRRIQAGVRGIDLTHLIPYSDRFVVRRVHTEEMAKRFSGKPTVGGDGRVIVL